MNKETENLNNLTDEQLFIACVRCSAYFKQQMLIAYKHGIEFEQLEYNECDVDINKIDDKNLPFYEWFALHYT